MAQAELDALLLAMMGKQALPIGERIPDPNRNSMAEPLPSPLYVDNMRSGGWQNPLAPLPPYRQPVSPLMVPGSDKGVPLQWQDWVIDDQGQGVPTVIGAMKRRL